tara:strand:- start:6701 stop:17269 length:10569 start_codon:yes stop_codon:yes gene_type:complete
MGKIYRLSNGGLVTVMVDDETNFFNILKERNLTAELVNDPNTEYDNVPSYKVSLSSNDTQEDPTVEVEQKTTLNQEISTINKVVEIIPKEQVKDYVIGEGLDFAKSTPNEILTYQNAKDYFNQRSEVMSYFNSDDYKELDTMDKVVNNSMTKNSGYLSLDIYGPVSTWDENATMRNKEVRDKIFAGTHGYNPYEDKLYKLQDPVEVDLGAKTYALKQQTSYQTFNSFMESLENPKKYPEYVDETGKVISMEPSTKTSDMFPDSGISEDAGMVAYNTPPILDVNALSKYEKDFVDTFGPIYYSYGFNMEQAKGFHLIKSWDQQAVKVTAMNGKSITIDVDVKGDTAKEQLKIFMDFVNANTHSKGGEDMLGEMFYEETKPTEEQIHNIETNFTVANEIIDKMRIAFNMPDATDAEIINIYNDFSRYRENEIGDITKHSDAYHSDLDIRFEGSNINWSLEKVKYFQDALANELGENYTDFISEYIGALNHIVSYEKDFYEGENGVILEAFLQDSKAVSEFVKGEGVYMSDFYKDKPKEFFTKHAMGQTLWKELLESEYYKTWRKNWIKQNKNNYDQTVDINSKKLYRFNETIDIIQKNASEHVEFFSSNAFDRSELQEVVYKDMVLDIKNVEKEIAESLVEIDFLTETMDDLYSTQIAMEEELISMGINQYDVLEDIAEKYNITSQEDFLSNENAMAEFREYEKKYSDLYNEYEILITQTIPANNKLLYEKYDVIDTSAWKAEEMKLMMDVLGRNSEWGTYYSTIGGIAIMETVIGGTAALVSSVTDAYLELGEYHPAMQMVLEDLNSWGDSLGTEVKKRAEYGRSTLALPTQWGDITGVSSAMDYLVTNTLQTAPILILASASGGYALPVMGVYSGSQKYDNMRRSRNLFEDTAGMFGQDFTLGEMLLNSVVTGTAEGLTEKITFGQWRKLGYFANNPAAKLGFEKALRKSIYTPKKMAQFVAYNGKQFTEEGVSEMIADFSSNTMDVWTGVEGANYWEGIDESFVNGFFLSTLMHMPAIANQAVIQPFTKSDTNQRLGEIAEKLAELKSYKGKSYEELTDKEKEEVDKQVAELGLQAEELLTRELFKVDLLTNEQKQRLLEINRLDLEARKSYEIIMADRSIKSEDKIKRLTEIEQGIESRRGEKDKILATVNPEAAEKKYKESMQNIKDQADLANEMGGVEVELYEQTDEQFQEDQSKDEQNKSADEVADITAESEATIVTLTESIEESDKNIKESKDKITETRKEIKDIKNDKKKNDNQKLKEIDKKKKEIDKEKKKIINESKNKKDAENLIRDKGVLQTNVKVGASILKDNPYGRMRPIYDKNGNLTKLKLYVNKDKSIADGMWTTGAHEMIHAVFANTIKSDPAMRLKLGGAMAKILKGKNIEFKTMSAADMFNKRVAQYSIDKQGEEALAIASEMLIKGDIILKESTLGKLGSIFRRWSMDRYGTTFNFNNSNDILNFIKDYHYSIKNNKPSKAIAKMLAKGANGKMFEGAKTPQDRSNLDMHSAVVGKSIESDPDLRPFFDDVVKDKGGKVKHRNHEDFKASPEYIEGYEKIVDTNKLNGIIQAGMTERGLPPDALKDFTRKVKEELGIRYLKNYNVDKNDSLFGWLTGVAGGQGQSIIYRAKGDVMNEYKKQVPKTSIDKPISESGTVADVIQAEKDVLIDKIENADMSPELLQESVQDVNDLIMVMDMLGFSNNVKQAVKDIVKRSNINLDNLTYKGVRDLLLSVQSKATTEKNVVPTGPLFEILNAISAEFGVDPLRILAKQDLNAEQRKAAQEYIYNKSTNDDGSFNTSLLDILPEGQDRDGRATGVANTKLGEFYTKGDRLKVREGAKKGLGQKFAQNKRTNVTREQLLGLFGINTDGTFQPGTKADGAIRELIVQVSQLAANQEIRLDAVENRVEAASNIARLKDGTSLTMYSNPPKINTKQKVELAKQLFDKNSNVYAENIPTIRIQTLTHILKYGDDIKKLQEKRQRIIYYDAPSPLNPDITMGEQLKLDVDDFLKQYPQYYDQLRNTMTGGIGISTFFSVENFEKMFPREKYELGGLFAQQSLPRNSYTFKSDTKTGKKRRFNPKTLNKKDDSKQRLDILYNFAKAMEGYVKTNKNPKPGNIYLFSLMASDTVNNQNGAITRILSPFSFYTIMKNGQPDTTNIMTEEHAGPQKSIMDMLVNAARVGKVDTVWPIVEAVFAQGTLLDVIDKRLKDVKNRDGKNLQENLPDIFWDSIAERVLDGKLDDLPQGSIAMVRYFVAGKELNIDIINTIKWKNGKTLAEIFGVKVDGEISPTIFQAQYDLVLDYLSGNITKEKLAEAVNKLNIEGINYVDAVKEARDVKTGVLTLNNNMYDSYSKPVKVRGMSTFDFDDTLARTKSGVRYTMPNNTGEPAPGRKVIFLAGSAGSGKSNVVKQLGLQEKGFKIVNQDIALEWLTKNSGLPTDMRDFTPEQASKWGELQWEARDIAQRKAIKFRGRGDGVVVDGTGASTVSLFTQAQKYKDAGYDVKMLFVESSLDTALARNKARKERSLKDFIVERNWKAVQKNKKAFKEEFGNNFTEVNTDNLKQGDAMPNNVVVAIDNFTSGYIKGRLTAEEFASKGGDLLDQGASFDFSEFNKVVDGTPGPLLDKARNRAKKFGTKDMFVLTARPQQSAFAIQQFLKGQGLDIPIENITGLANSSGNAKAQWMLDKFAEGYNDMYFVDDALQNVEAVKAVLDQLDIKSKVVQAKLKDQGKLVEPGNNTMYSKVVNPDNINIDKEFNNILEVKKGVDANKRFSSAEARKRGAKFRLRLYIPPSAEDFKGLLYYFLPKGKEGEKALKFFEKTLLKPFARGIRAWNSYKQNMVNEYNDLRKKFPDVTKVLNDRVPGTSFTNDTAIRVYLWTKAGFDIPGISKALQKRLVTHVNGNPNLKAFADGLSKVTRRKDGYLPPNKNWMMEAIPTDLRNLVDKVGRKEFLQEWINNKEEIFSQENINKIEALYGSDFKSALLDILFRMENGGNRKQGKSKLVNNLTDWINGSIGAIMFFNMRSALLQTLSTVNFINWSDNNMFKAAAAFANQKQFWQDFVMLFNSPMLKQRRKGLQTDVSAAELTKSFKERGYSPTTVISYLLQKGFLPTQIADSFAIAFGGASFYRNRYNKYIKQGMSAKEAHDKTMLEFQEIAEETQQSSREDLVSPQQAGPLGRLILAFQNVTMQYGRLTKKALSDTVNGRGDMKTNVSKLIYYGMVQNVIFAALQSALAFIMWGDDEEEIKDQTTRTANSVLDSFLRGTGIYGAIVSTIKNTIIQWDLQSNKDYGKARPEKILLEIVNISPPIGSKLRKVMNAYYAEEFNRGLSDELGLRLENPTIKKWASLVEAATNIPLARLLNKANNLEEAITGNHELWKRIAMFAGWSMWNIGVEDEEVVAAKESLAEKKEIEKEKEKEEKKIEKEKEKEEKKKAEEEEKKRKGIKTVRCSGIRSNGERCKLTTETAEKKYLCPHHMEFTDGMDRDGDGIKEYRCTFIKKNGEQCKMKGEYGKEKRCYHHVDK